MVSCPGLRGVPRIWQGGGGQEIFFFGFGNLHVAKRHAAHGEAMHFVWGVRGHAPPRKFFKMMKFGAFWCIFRSHFVFKKLPFFI